MNDFALSRNQAWDGTRALAQVAVADAAGMVWVHSNPAELYRWVSRRNDLLGTIAVALNAGAPPRPRAD